MAAEHRQAVYGLRNTCSASSLPNFMLWQKQRVRMVAGAVQSGLNLRGEPQISPDHSFTIKMKIINRLLTRP